jgi:hypothetical protein
MDKEQIIGEYKDTFDCVYHFLDAEGNDEFSLRKKLLEQLVTDAHHLAALQRVDQGEVAANIIEEWKSAHPDADDGKPMPVTPAGSEPDRVLKKEEPVKRGPGRPKKVHQ